MIGTMLTLMPGDEAPRARLFVAWPGDNEMLAIQQGAVGGWLEQVPGFDSIVHDGQTHRCVALCDEEAKLKGSGVINIVATARWEIALRLNGRTRPNGDVLVGPVVVLYGDAEFME